MEDHDSVFLVLFSIKLILMIMLKNTLTRLKFLQKENYLYVELLKSTRKYILPNTPLRKQIDEIANKHSG